MGTKTIKITVGDLGKPTIEAIGFSGCGCTEATKPIENAYGGPVERTDKPEMNEIDQAADNEETLSL